MPNEAKPIVSSGEKSRTALADVVTKALRPSLTDAVAGALDTTMAWERSVARVTAPLDAISAQWRAFDTMTDTMTAWQRSVARVTAPLDAISAQWRALDTTMAWQRSLQRSMQSIARPPVSIPRFFPDLDLWSRFTMPRFNTVDLVNTTLFDIARWHLSTSSFVSQQLAVFTSLQRYLAGLSDMETLWGRLLHRVAVETREHLLSLEGMDRGPVEEFAFDWLGLFKPSRREDRDVIVDAVVNALLSDMWDSRPRHIHRSLKQLVAKEKRVERPLWTHQTGGRRVGLLDQFAAADRDRDGVELLMVPAPAAEEVWLSERVEDSRLLALLTRLDPDERMVLFYNVEVGVTWAQAAQLVGRDVPFGERVRRKVRYLQRRLRSHLADARRQ